MRNKVEIIVQFVNASQAAGQNVTEADVLDVILEDGSVVATLIFAASVNAVLVRESVAAAGTLTVR